MHSCNGVMHDLGCLAAGMFEVDDFGFRPGLELFLELG